MLAISRALLSDPKLLVMDEPTEGLAPVIVDQVERMLVTLAEEGEMAILVIEQNIGVATAVSDRVAIMVNGRINRIMDAKELASDRELQQRLLGVGRHADVETTPQPAEMAQAQEQLADVYRIERSGGETADSSGVRAYRPVTDLPNRWNVPAATLRQAAVEKTTPADETEEDLRHPLCRADRPHRAGRRHLRHQGQGTALHRRPAEGARHSGAHRRPVDIRQAVERRCARQARSPACIRAVRPQSCQATAAARWRRWPRPSPAGSSGSRDIGGIISAGGSGGTTLATAGMRVLPVGIPKIMVSTVAAGDVAKYVGGADIMMFHSVADVQGLNSITEAVLGNAAHAMAGMVAQLPNAEAREAKRKLARPAIGITMFGVTTPCVQAVTKRLEADYDCLVFHATGIGGRAMEGLGNSAPALRLPRHHHDGSRRHDRRRRVPGRRGRASARRSAPDCPMSARSARSTWSISGRATACRRNSAAAKFVIHNPNVTLMRTTRDENRAFGEWIGGRLNDMNGPVRFLLPEGGVSMLDAPGQPFLRSGGRQRAVRGDREDGSHLRRRGASSGCAANINDERLRRRRWSRRSRRSRRR